MINKIFAIILLILLSLLVIPSENLKFTSVVIETMGYRITSNLVPILFFLLAISFIIRIFMILPYKISNCYNKLRHVDAFKTLQDALISFYNLDIKTAKKHIYKLKNIKSTALDIIKIKIMHIEKADKNDMLASLNTLPNDSNNFALLMKIELYESLSDWQNIANCATTLLDSKLSASLFNTLMFATFKIKDWENARRIAKYGMKSNLINKDSYIELIKLTRYFTALDLADKNSAILELKDSISERNIEPYIKIIELYITNGDIKNAIYYSKKAWAYFPHKRIAREICKLSNYIVNKDFYKACKAITSNNKECYEAFLLMAQAYISLNDISAANELLLKASSKKELDYRLYILMTICSSLSSKNSKDMLNLLDKALKADPSNEHTEEMHWDFCNMSYSRIPSNRSIRISIT